ncbi:hypothetical protein [Vibrio crassostreae]|uniref:hypothetical protein n=1 Tax=Vibrio crassostreae TaxID=246167 RepID=UPI001B300454|nr:hypothetical protein [Vibrio crassostreae]
MDKVIEQGLREQAFVQNVRTLDQILARDKEAGAEMLTDNTHDTKPTETQPNTLFSRLKNWLFGANK